MLKILANKNANINCILMYQFISNSISRSFNSNFKFYNKLIFRLIKFLAIIAIFQLGNLFKFIQLSKMIVNCILMSIMI